MKNIIYLNGNAVYPKTPSNKVIVHICNDEGRWGGGFVLSISKRWSEPEKQYKKWIRNREGKLGEIQFVPVEKDIVVVNMIAQESFVSFVNPVAVRYEALKKCLQQVSDSIKGNEVSVHMPRIGCGIAGGKWENIEPIIIETLFKNDIQVYVYDYTM